MEIVRSGTRHAALGVVELGDRICQPFAHFLFTLSKQATLHGDEATNPSPSRRFSLLGSSQHALILKPREVTTPLIGGLRDSTALFCLQRSSSQAPSQSRHHLICFAGPRTRSKTSERAAGGEQTSDLPPYGARLPPEICQATTKPWSCPWQHCRSHYLPTNLIQRGGKFKNKQNSLLQCACDP